MADTNEWCEGCRFWKEYATTERRFPEKGPSEDCRHGVCRRTPPSGWANSWFDDWCGEFEAREVQAPPAQWTREEMAHMRALQKMGCFSGLGFNRIPPVAQPAAQEGEE